MVRLFRLKQPKVLYFGRARTLDAGSSSWDARILVESKKAVQLRIQAAGPLHPIGRGPVSQSRYLCLWQAGLVKRDHQVLGDPIQILEPLARLAGFFLKGLSELILSYQESPAPVRLKSRQGFAMPGLGLAQEYVLFVPLGFKGNLSLLDLLFYFL